MQNPRRRVITQNAARQMIWHSDKTKDSPIIIKSDLSSEGIKGLSAEFRKDLQDSLQSRRPIHAVKFSSRS